MLGTLAAYDWNQKIFFAERGLCTSKMTGPVEIYEVNSLWEPYLAIIEMKIQRNKGERNWMQALSLYSASGYFW